MLMVYFIGQILVGNHVVYLPRLYLLPLWYEKVSFPVLNVLPCNVDYLVLSVIIFYLYSMVKVTRMRGSAIRCVRSQR